MHEKVVPQSGGLLRIEGVTFHEYPSLTCVVWECVIGDDLGVTVGEMSTSKGFGHGI